MSVCQRPRILLSPRLFPPFPFFFFFLPSPFPPSPNVGAQDHKVEERISLAEIERVQSPHPLFLFFFFFFSSILFFSDYSKGGLSLEEVINMSSSRSKSPSLFPPPLPPFSPLSPLSSLFPIPLYGLILSPTFVGERVIEYIFLPCLYSERRSPSVFPFSPSFFLSSLSSACPFAPTKRGEENRSRGGVFFRRRGRLLFLFFLFFFFFPPLSPFSGGVKGKAT